MHRFVWVAAIALLVLACGGGGAVPTTPGTQPTTPPGMTDPPDATNPPQATPPQNAGDNKAKAQALIPSGSSAPISEVSVGNAYTVQVMSTQTLEQLGTFWTTAIPAAGLTESGRYTAGDTLIIAFTNPDGGITASKTDEGVLVTISVGTSG